MFRTYPKQDEIQRTRSFGFSILELLLVIAILSILAALGASALSGISAYQVATSASQLGASTQIARQMAITTGKPVNLRLYSLPNTIGGGSNYSAYQWGNTLGADFIAKSPLRKFPGNVAIRFSPIASTLLTTNATNATNVPGYLGQAISCCDVRFLPSGALDLPDNPAKWTLSLAVASAPPVSNDLPANFATLSIDPALGTVSIYRP